MSRIRIQTEKKLMPTEPNLYGIFFEDISRAGDGGIYPELLRNRTFEDSIPPKGCVLEEDGRVMVTPSGWRDQLITARGWTAGSASTTLHIHPFLPGTRSTQTLRLIQKTH